MLISARRVALCACSAAAFLVATGSWVADEIAAGAVLPDGRAYEMVSPPAKNGGDVSANSQRTRAAAAGTAVAFMSLTGFADVRGTGVATEYVSVRSMDSQPGTNGWATHAITPPQEPLSLFGAFQGLDPAYDGDFAPDLASGVFRAWSPLTNAPSVQPVENLYVRGDLRASGLGSSALVSACPLCDASSTPLPPVVSQSQRPFLAGTSADLGHVIFESRYRLTANATGSGAPNLYEWDHGTLRLAGILPNGTAAAISQAGQGASGTFQTLRTISSDGARIFFTDPSTGSDGKDGTLYMRTNGATTVQINVSERTDCAGDLTCGGNGVPDPSPAPSAPAKFWTATPSGSRVFFTTSEALTDDAPSDGDVKIYMYDATKSASDAHNLTLMDVDHEPADAANNAQGVMGVSDDGHYAYFITTGQLVAGKPLLGTELGIFLWHDGSVAFVGKLTNAGDLNRDLNAALWNLHPGDARVSPDGRRLLFMSTRGDGLTNYDHGSCPATNAGTCQEFYVYSAEGGHLACASCNPNGSPGTADATLDVRSGSGGSIAASHLGHALSDDGEQVFFSTREALVAQDTNGRADAYEYDVGQGVVRLISSGKDSSDSFFLDASASGDDVFFLTRSRLVGWDTDNNYDLYDARVHGGFPNPAAVPAECSGDACQDQPHIAPGVSLVASAAFSGTGNVNSVVRRKLVKATAKACKKGFVRKKVRGRVKCVKRKRHAAAKAGKRASSQRRNK